MKNIKETKKNETFSMFPSTKTLLSMLAQRLDISQAKVLDKLIKEKANRLNLIND